MRVEAWTPPGPDHEGLKKFMLSQILDSTRWMKLPGDEDGPKPPKETEREWLAKQIADAKDQVAQWEKSLAEEQDRCRKRTAWVRALRESIGEQPVTGEK